MNLDETDHDNSGPSDEDAADTSEDSDINRRADKASEAMTYLNLEEPPSPQSSASSHAPEVSRATVPPVDIIGKRQVSGLSPGTFSSTSSPNGLPSSLSDTVTGVEGPLTPRNNAGPFVFDGSAGRSLTVPLENVATIVSDPAAPLTNPPPLNTS